MRILFNNCILGLIVLFFAITILQLSRGLIAEAVGAAMIAGFLITGIKR